jgi:hypothetical protein
MGNRWFSRLQTGVAAVAGQEAAVCLRDGCDQPCPAGDRAGKAAWMREVAARLEAQLPEEVASRALQHCGRGCIQPTHIQKARELREQASDLDEVASLWKGRVLPGIVREGDVFHVTYPRCLCHHVNTSSERMPRSYCQCSRGWLLELFEGAFGMPVAVEILGTVQWGDPECRFEVRVG